jgi:aminoglycoside 3-N-acetyltransferase
MVVETLGKIWTKLGIKKGDTLLIHSNISSLLRYFLRQNYGCTPENIFDSIMSKVGPDGTVLLPTFNFGFCEGVEFNIYKTTSQMGILSEYSRTRKDAIRTGHPVYSFSVFGKMSEKFKNLKNRSGYGEDSPFSELLKVNGKVLVINLPDQNSMTFYHYVEEFLKVEYRYMKSFTAFYTGIDHKRKLETFQIYVRRLDLGVETSVERMRIFLESNNHYCVVSGPGSIDMRIINSITLFQQTSRIIQDGLAKQYLYKIMD